jgi:hypothetical protein
MGDVGNNNSEYSNNNPLTHGGGSNTASTATNTTARELVPRAGEPAVPADGVFFAQVREKHNSSSTLVLCLTLEGQDLAK